MKQNRKRKQWILWVMVCCVFMLVAISCNDAATESTADGSESTTLDTLAVEALENYPQFPIPVPKTSTFKVIPRNLVAQAGQKTNLRSVVYDKILPALDAAGYEYSFFKVKNNGIAIATRLEKINKDGTPKNGAERYLTGDKDKPQFSLKEYLSSLLKAKPGYYRVMVFVISPYAITQDKIGLTKTQADSTFNAGATKPLGELLDKEFTADYDCTTLVYAFVKPNEEDPASELQPSPLTCQVHLEKSGIWPNLLNKKP